MRNLTPLAGVSTALSLGDRECISLVGGGGKTTLLFALGEQLSGSVVLSTTTKMGTDRTEGYTPLIDPSPTALRQALARDRVVLTWKADEEHRAVGYSSEEAAAFWSVADYVVLEADGSRRRPFKAPAPHEPVVAPVTSVLLACIGVRAIGGVIEEVCHRPEAVAAITGASPTDRLSAEHAAAVLMSDAGSRKHCPPAARFVVMVNQVSDENEASATALRQALPEDIEMLAIRQEDR